MKGAWNFTGVRKILFNRYDRLIFHFTIKITIDGSGRLVIPKRLREQFHFREGMTIEVLAENDGILLRLPQATGRLVEREGVLVPQADSVSPFDATAFINQQRHSRSLQILTSKVGA